MYNEIHQEYIGLKEACEYLGIGRSTMLRLCKTKPHGFPAVKVGNRWQFDFKMLTVWRMKWFEGAFEI